MNNHIEAGDIVEYIHKKKLEYTVDKVYPDGTLSLKGHDWKRYKPEHFIKVNTNIISYK